MPKTLERNQKPRIRLGQGPGYGEVLRKVKEQSLHTVCQSAHCPNVGECWSERTATFMLLGNVCTRACRFCAVQSGRPTELDLEEPQRVAEAIRDLGIDYAVITSVNRDELEDGGAAVWAETVCRARELRPGVLLELLIPDFCGKFETLDMVLATQPEVLNHNVETVPRLYETIQPWSDWDVSLATIEHAKKHGAIAKSGIITGLGETDDEMRDAIRQVRDAGCDILTVGQYYQPSPKHAPVERFLSDEEFESLQAYGETLGFAAVMSGARVRSSYRAHWAYQCALRKRAE